LPIVQIAGSPEKDLTFHSSMSYLYKLIVDITFALFRCVSANFFSFLFLNSN